MKKFFRIVVFVILISSLLLALEILPVQATIDVPVSPQKTYEGYPSVYVDKVVWQDHRNGNYDIYLFDLTDQIEIPICTEEHDQVAPRIYGDKIVWQDQRHGDWRNADIYMYDLKTGTETPICTEPHSQINPVIWNDVIIWMDYRRSLLKADLYMYNLTTKKQTPFVASVSDKGRVSIDNGKAVFEDLRYGQKDIFMKDVYTGVETPICTDTTNQVAPSISGNNIVWQDDRADNLDIFTYNLMTKRVQPVTSGGSYHVSPVISGGTIVWEDYRDEEQNGADIYMRAIDVNGNLGAESAVVTKLGHQLRPTISGKIIAYQNNAENNDQVNVVNMEKRSVRVAGPSRYETAIALSKTGWNSSDMVVLARGDLFPDALSGAPLAAQFKAPVLLTPRDGLLPAVKEEINRLGAKEVIILGSTSAVSSSVANDIAQSCGIPNEKIHRFGGKDRYETSTLIASQINKPKDAAAIMATGENFPDALSIASLAAFKGMPILLATGTKLTPDCIDVLDKKEIKKVIIVGGSDVVSSDIENWLSSNNYNIQRLYGDERYATGRAIADYALSQGMSAATIFVATGEDFPDALVAGPMAGLAAKKAPLLMVQKRTISPTIHDWFMNNKDDIKLVYYIGDQDVVSTDISWLVERMIVF